MFLNQNSLKKLIPKFQDQNQTVLILKTIKIKF